MQTEVYRWRTEVEIDVSKSVYDAFSNVLIDPFVVSMLFCVQESFEIQKSFWTW